MNKGFTLIEIVVALLLAAMISLSLYQLLNQSSRAVSLISNIISVDTPLIPFYNQIQKDVTGIFVPKSADIPKDKTEATGDTDKDKSGKEPQKKIDDIFYLDNKKQGQLFWSFITTAGIGTLDKNGKINPVPFVRRVAYLLEDDPNRAGTSRLIYRFATDKLDVEAIKKSDFSPSYTLMTGIKNISFVFDLFEYKEKKDDQGRAPQQKTKEVPKTVYLTDWNKDEIYKKYKSLIPAYITIKGTHTDIKNKVEYPFEFSFKVFAYEEYKPKEEPKKSEERDSKSVFGELSEFLEGKLMPKFGASLNS